MSKSIPNPLTRFALASILTAEKRAKELDAVMESCDAADNEAMRAAFRKYVDLAKNAASAYKLAAEALEDAIMEYR